MASHLERVEVPAGSIADYSRGAVDAKDLSGPQLEALLTGNAVPAGIRNKPGSLTGTLGRVLRPIFTIGRSSS